MRKEKCNLTQSSVLEMATYDIQYVERSQSYNEIKCVFSR